MRTPVLAIAVGIAFLASALLKISAIPNGGLDGTILASIVGGRRDFMTLISVAEGIGALCILFDVRRRSICVVFAAALIGVALYSVLGNGGQGIARPCGCFGHKAVEGALRIPTAIRNAVFVAALLGCAIGNAGGSRRTA